MMEDKYSLLEREKLMEANEMSAARWVLNELEAVDDYARGTHFGTVGLIIKAYKALLDEILMNGVTYTGNTVIDLARVINKINKQRNYYKAAESPVDTGNDTKQFRRSSAKVILDSNRDAAIAWAAEGKSYWWIGRQLGIGERGRGSVSAWFRKQGIHRKTIETQTKENDGQRKNY
jgi:hypothetical protein